MAQTVQYDQIGSKYDEYAQTATLKRAESYTFFHMVGTLAGKRVLVAGGRFVAYTVNPAFTLSKPNSTKYGATVLHQTPEVDRYMCDLEFVTDPPTPYQHPQWNQATHEWAIREAGFREFAWAPSEVAPEDVAHYGEAYWHDFYDNCLVIGLVCQK